MKTFEYRIEQDSDVRNPRDEFDNISTFYCVRNNRYSTGGKNDFEFSYTEDLEEKIKDFRKEKAVIIEFHNPNVGTCYAVVERDQLQDEYIKYGQTMRQALYHARQCAKGEIATYLAWADGEVYGYTVEDNEGNHVDSCWGFYGYEYCKEEAESVVKWHEEQEEKEDKEIISRLQFA